MSVSWFYVEEKQKVGPLDQESLINLLHSMQLNKDSYVWRKGFKDWKKIKDVEELKIFLNKELDLLDNRDEEIEVNEESEVIEDNGIGEKTEISLERASFDWFNLSKSEKIFILKQDEDETIYGPYSLEMLSRLYQENRINSRTLTFSLGMENWIFLGDIPIYEELFSEQPPSIEEVERRKNRKRPFTVKIRMNGESQLLEGFCRDITIGGMQILISDFHGKKGDVLSLEVHPESAEDYFSISGKVARILDGNQGLFIRFTEVGKDARESIIQYIEAAA